MDPVVEDHIPMYQVRPRFEIETTQTTDQIIEKINTGLKNEKASCRGWAKSEFATLYLPEEEQHYWSPQLHLSLEKTEKGCLMRGLYGPRPAVWTMFIFFYFLIGTAILIISVIGLANISINQSGAILWLVPVLVIAFLTLYLVAFFGKKLAKAQMVILHKFLEESTEIKI